MCGYVQKGSTLTTIVIVAAIALIFGVMVLSSMEEGGFQAVRNLISQAGDKMGTLFGIANAGGASSGKRASLAGEPPQADDPPKGAGNSCDKLEDCPGILKCNPVAQGYPGQENKACCLGNRKWDGDHCVYMKEGKRCKKGLCGKNMQCQSAHPKASQSDFYCCPQGKHWDGNKCRELKSYDILYLQVNAQIDKFKQKAESATQHWGKNSPFKQCQDRLKTKVKTGKVCNIPDLSSSLPAQAVAMLLPKLHDCAEQFGYEGEYTRVVGVVDRKYVTKFNGKRTSGLTQLRSSAIFANAVTLGTTVTHELGHTHGLCDVGYGGGSCDTARGQQCQSGYCTGTKSTSCTAAPEFIRNCCPNAPGAGVETILCSANLCTTEGRQCQDADGFSDMGRAHLEKEFEGYCQ